MLGEIGEAGAWASANGATPAIRDSTSVLRGRPGVASGGEDLPNVTGQWFHPQKGDPGALDPRVARIPGQIAAKLRGMHFKNFDDFRETFWKMVAADPVLSTGWSPANLSRLKRGLAPFAPASEAVGGGSNAVYQLDHKLAIKNEGGVYDMSNIDIVTPGFHAKAGEH